MSHRVCFVLSIVVLVCVVIVSGIQYRDKCARDRAIELDVNKNGWVWGPRLVGFWQVRGQLSHIGQDHGKLFVVDEFSAMADGEIRGRTLSIPAWKISGRVAPDYGSISWSDGAVWTFVAPFADHYVLPYVEQRR